MNLADSAGVRQLSALEPSHGAPHGQPSASAQQASSPAVVITPMTKAQLLAMWDDATKELDRIVPTIPPHRFQEMDTAFGQWTGPGVWHIMYAIDNEIHHRGQGYAYLRALGIEPPAFYDRS